MKLRGAPDPQTYRPYMSSRKREGEGSTGGVNDRASEGESTKKLSRGDWRKNLRWVPFLVWFDKFLQGRGFLQRCRGASCWGQTKAPSKSETTPRKSPTVDGLEALRGYTGGGHAEKTLKKTSFRIGTTSLPAQNDNSSEGKGSTEELEPYLVLMRARSRIGEKPIEGPIEKRAAPRCAGKSGKQCCRKRHGRPA